MSKPPTMPCSPTLLFPHLQEHDFSDFVDRFWPEAWKALGGNDDADNQLEGEVMILVRWDDMVALGRLAREYDKLKRWATKMQEWERKQKRGP